MAKVLRGGTGAWEWLRKRTKNGIFPFADWEEFAGELRQKFQIGQYDEQVRKKMRELGQYDEQVRKKMRELKQKGSVLKYVAAFRALEEVLILNYWPWLDSVQNAMLTKGYDSLLDEHCQQILNEYTDLNSVQKAKLMRYEQVQLKKDALDKYYISMIGQVAVNNNKLVGMIQSPLGPQVETRSPLVGDIPLYMSFIVPQDQDILSRQIGEYGKLGFQKIQETYCTGKKCKAGFNRKWVEDFIRQCVVCIQFSKFTNQMPVKAIVYSHPMERLQIDFNGYYNVVHGGNAKICAIIDCISQLSWLFAIPRKGLSFSG
ncbi:hypothetical protein MIR68_004656 [Amoeboaphelidium protococcarum]|nr:hypothetical protein MIR68_004656 [Amoeboaphelidium protococcarum]